MEVGFVVDPVVVGLMIDFLVITTWVELGQAVNFYSISDCHWEIVAAATERNHELEQQFLSKAWGLQLKGCGQLLPSNRRQMSLMYR
jgi:hypothetical protein